VDLFRQPDGRTALCVVVDYKSSGKQLHPVLLANGLQLQLIAYANVLRQWPNPRAAFGVDRLVPAGVFYVTLRGKYGREANRLEALRETEQARKLAYRHTGRFDTRALPHLDGRGAKEGDQFNYRLTQAGQVYRSSREALEAAGFSALLDSVETNLREMGQRVYAGTTDVDPYQKGNQTACGLCSYQGICRIDHWSHRFRVLRRDDGAE
jgi:ATP-dependent helicase/nuclease subunit B